MKIILLISLLLSCSPAMFKTQKNHNTSGFSALLFEFNSDKPIFYANAKATTFSGDSISMVTSGDEGMIFFPSLPTEFILNIYHKDFVEYRDTIFNTSPRCRTRIEIKRR